MFGLVSKKKYEAMEFRVELAEKELETYKENENKETIKWAVRLMNDEMLYIIYGTHCKWWGNDLRIYDKNEVVGEFANVEFYVRYDDFDTEENYLDSL